MELPIPGGEGHLFSYDKGHGEQEVRLQVRSLIEDVDEILIYRALVKWRTTALRTGVNRLSGHFSQPRSTVRGVERVQRLLGSWKINLSLLPHYRSKPLQTKSVENVQHMIDTFPVCRQWPSSSVPLRHRCLKATFHRTVGIRKRGMQALISVSTSKS